MTKCLQNRICHFVFASLSKVYLRQIHKYKTSFNAISIGRAGKCLDDDDDDSGGRTQRDCLRLTAPWVRVSLTEAKTNTVCICEQVFLGED